MAYTKRTKGPGKHGYRCGGRCPPEYQCWSGMIQRCLNPRCREFKYYGGRGITVCDRWLEAQGFPNFLADVGPQPFKRASIHRLDNDGDYEPGNVVWANPQTQLRNTRANRLLTHAGRTMVLAAWAEEIGMKHVTLSQRLFKGWTVDRALTQLVQPRRPSCEWRRRPDAKKPGPKPRRSARRRRGTKGKTRRGP